MLRGCAARSPSVVGPEQKQNRAEPREAPPEQLSLETKKPALQQQQQARECQAGRELQEWLHPHKEGKLRPGEDETYLGSGQARSPEGPSTGLFDF